MESCAMNSRKMSRTVNARDPRDSARILVENYENFKRSGLPNRIMVCGGGGGLGWVDLGGDELEALKLGFWEGKAVVEAEIGGFRYLFDFVRMLRIEFQSGRRSSIAWIDADGKCFSPKSFVYDDAVNEFQEDCVEEDLKIEIGLNLGKRKRDLESVSESGGSSSSDVGNQSNNRGDLEVNTAVNAKAANVVDVCKWPGCKMVKEDWRGYQLVKKLFSNGPIYEVTAVYQCCRVGYVDKARGLAFRSHVEVVKAVRGESNEVFAWYGTSAEGVKRILTHGFGAPGDVKEGYGIGVCLCPVRLPQIRAMQLEADENGEKHVILCRVLLGNVEKVAAGSEQSRPSNVNFDNGVDDLRNPKRYIVWCANMNTHILPECVVSFKSSGSVPVRTCEGVKQFSSVPRSTVPLSVVISKLTDHIPYEKVNAIRHLSSECKAGRISREALVRGVRYIASDPILKLATFSAYQEFNNKK